MGRASSLSTKKRLRESKARQARNKANKTRLKSQVKKIRATGSADQAKKMLPETYSVIDKAVRKGVLRKNTAARLKSRLTRQSNQRA